jgi:hypothetical protein
VVEADVYVFRGRVPLSISRSQICGMRVVAVGMSADIQFIEKWHLTTVSAYPSHLILETIRRLRHPASESHLGRSDAWR